MGSDEYFQYCVYHTERVLLLLLNHHKHSLLLLTVIYVCIVALHLSQQEDFSLTSESLQTQSSAAAEGGEEEEEEETSSSVERLEDCHAGSHLEPNLTCIVSSEQKGTTVQLLCSATTWLQVTVIHSMNSLFPAVH